MSNVSTHRNVFSEHQPQVGDIRPCQQCGKPYKAVRTEQRFCCPRCRSANWDASHPRVDIGQVKLDPKKGDRKPTAEELTAAGFRINRKGAR